MIIFCEKMELQRLFKGRWINLLKEKLRKQYICQKISPDEVVPKYTEDEIVG